MAKKKETKIRNTLKRHEDNIDKDLGYKVINDFLQLGHMLDRLKDSDSKAYHAVYCLIESRLELESQMKERGKRIAKLQRMKGILEREEIGVKCDHKWVDMEDGSLDKFCVRCSNKSKQAAMTMHPEPSVSIEFNIAEDKYMAMPMMANVDNSVSKIVIQDKVVEMLNEHMKRMKSKVSE